MAERCKAGVGGRSRSGVGGSNPAGGMNACHVACCQVEVSARGRSLVQRSATDRDVSN